MKKYWTEKEKAKFKRLYPIKGKDEMLKIFSCSDDSYKNMAHTLQVKKRIPNAGRFQKGIKVWNKGTKGLMKGSCTTFKKGHKPHNTKHDGFERVSKDGYIEVRIREKEFKFKHLVVWEKENGKVPKGMMIIFADGNKRNFDPGNLKMISRAENMRRNSISRFPSELISAIKLVSKLKKQINEKH